MELLGQLREKFQSYRTKWIVVRHSSCSSFKIQLSFPPSPLTYTPHVVNYSFICARSVSRIDLSYVTQRAIARIKGNYVYEILHTDIVLKQ